MKQIVMSFVLLVFLFTAASGEAQRSCTATADCSGCSGLLLTCTCKTGKDVTSCGPCTSGGRGESGNCTSTVNGVPRIAYLNCPDCINPPCSNPNIAKSGTESGQPCTPPLHTVSKDEGLAGVPVTVLPSNSPVVLKKAILTMTGEGVYAVQYQLEKNPESTVRALGVEIGIRVGDKTSRIIRLDDGWLGSISAEATEIVTSADSVEFQAPNGFDAVECLIAYAESEDGAVSGADREGISARLKQNRQEMAEAYRQYANILQTQGMARLRDVLGEVPGSNKQGAFQARARLLAIYNKNGGDAVATELKRKLIF